MVPLEHNIVNLLYSIKGLIESHLDRTQEGHFPKVGERLKHSEEVLRKAFYQTDQALKITKRLSKLHYPKNGAGKVEAEKTRSRVSLRYTWNQVVRVLKQGSSLDGIKLIERIPLCFPPIHCGRDDFKEILYCLTKNALQAMKGQETGDKGQGDKLILRAQMSFSQKEAHYAVISLSDTGPGIPQDHLPYIFKPFFTTKPEGEGNGLGLYLTKQLVEKNCGRMTVSSFEGSGTTFTLEFPPAVKS